jgi:hypothetical protein
VKKTIVNEEAQEIRKNQEDLLKDFIVGGKEDSIFSMVGDYSSFNFGNYEGDKFHVLPTKKSKTSDKQSFFQELNTVELDYQPKCINIGKYLSYDGDVKKNTDLRVTNFVPIWGVISGQRKTKDPIIPITRNYGSWKHEHCFIGLSINLVCDDKANMKSIRYTENNDLRLKYSVIRPIQRWVIYMQVSMIDC